MSARGPRRAVLCAAPEAGYAVGMNDERRSPTMRIITTMALASLVALAPWAASAEISTDTVRQKAEQACYDDVNRLCAPAIPDEDKIVACMKLNRAGLSQRCRTVYDASVK